MTILNNTFHNFKRLAAPLTAMAVIAACATTEPNPQIEQLEKRLETAQSNPTVFNASPTELNNAKARLNAAQSAYENNRTEKLEHELYMIDRLLTIAETEGREADVRGNFEDLRDRRADIRLDAREREIDRLSSELNEYKTKETDHGTVIVLQDLLFAYNKAELQPGSVRSLRPLANYLNTNSGKTIIVEGHTDSTGSSSYNMQLSKQRAEAVKKALVSMGIKGSRISTRGLGEDYPVANNGTEAGKQQNRRVEVTIQ
ncbi:MAG: OmpA family protein [Pseudomonadota bacterium]